jgi:hypothetical protein
MLSARVDVLAGNAIFIQLRNSYYHIPLMMVISRSKHAAFETELSCLCTIDVAISLFYEIIMVLHEIPRGWLHVETTNSSGKLMCP